MNKYYSLKEITENIPSILSIDNFSYKLNKRVFYDDRGDCRTGTLVGIAVDDKIYYIMNQKDKEVLVPIWKSITVL